MRLRKGVVPLIIFLLLAAGAVTYWVVTHDQVPMENGESIFQQP